MILFLNIFRKIILNIFSFKTEKLSTINNSTFKHKSSIQMKEAEFKQVLRKLQRKYPKKEGWTIEPREGKDKKKPEFIIQRRNSDNALERVIVDAKQKKSLTTKDFKRVNTYARNLAGNKSFIVGKVFLLPDGVEAIDIPKGFSVVFYTIEESSTDVQPVEVEVMNTN
jgi:hypothetical protein